MCRLVMFTEESDVDVNWSQTFLTELTQNQYFRIKLRQLIIKEKL